MGGRVLAIVDRLISRKLWLAVSSEVLVALWPDVPDDTRAIIFGAVGAIYIVAQGIVDALQGSKDSVSSL